MNESPATRYPRDPPPRHVDLLTSATVLFGSSLQQGAWFIFCLSSLWFWVLISVSDVRYWFESGKEWKEVPAQVVSAEETIMTLNGLRVYRILYAFDLNGQTYRGTSFADRQRYKGGQHVTVRYDASNPDNAFVVGSRRSLLPGAVSQTLLPKIISGVIIGFLVYGRWRFVKLLRIGEFTTGKLLKKEDTDMSEDNIPVYKYSFQFERGGRWYTATCETLLHELVEDEEQEIILFDPDNPDYNMVFDSVPHVPHISGQGRFEPLPINNVAYSILPVLGIGIQVFFILVQPDVSVLFDGFGNR